MSMRLGIGLGLARGGRAGGAAPAYQQILDLAADDGWTAVYDPTNPDTRTLRESGGSQYSAALADGLGNLPDMVQATEADQPVFSPGAFGQLAGLEFDGVATRLTSAPFAAERAQPNFFMAVVRDDATDNNTRTMISSPVGAAENTTSTTGAGRALRLYAGKAVTASLSLGNDPAVFGILFNSASSLVYVNGQESDAFDPGTRGQDGMRLGTNSIASVFWLGLIGPVLVFDGEPASAVCIRMSDLLHSLTGIAKA